MSQQRSWGRGTAMAVWGAGWGLVLKNLFLLILAEMWACNILHWVLSFEDPLDKENVL